MKQSGFVILAMCVLSVPAAAHADAAEDAASARSDVQQFASSVADATKNGMFGNNNFFRPPGECTAAVTKGTDAGLKATDTFEDGEGKTVLWKRAADTCTQYAKLHTLAQTIDVIHQQLADIEAYVGPDGKPISSVSGDAWRDTVKSARVCVDNVDKAIKAGVATDIAFAPNANHHDTRITLAEARAKCEAFIDWGTKAANADDERQAGEVAALKAKWSKLGASGDRLKYLIENGHHIILGKGCKELGDKAKITSSVFYEVYSDDASWIVYKTQWKKHKKTGSSDRRFRRDGGYSCK